MKTLTKLNKALESIGSRLDDKKERYEDLIDKIALNIGFALSGVKDLGIDIVDLDGEVNIHANPQPLLFDQNFTRILEDLKEWGDSKGENLVPHLLEESIDRNQVIIIKGYLKTIVSLSEEIFTTIQDNTTHLENRIKGYKVDEETEQRMIDSLKHEDSEEIIRLNKLDRYDEELSYLKKTIADERNLS